MRTAVVTCFVGLLIATAAGSAQGQTVFLDDFSDGDASDGRPAEWNPLSITPGVFDASSGDYQLIPDGGDLGYMASIVGDLNLSDVSIRAQVRKLQKDPFGGEWVGIMGHFQSTDPNLTSDEFNGVELYLEQEGDLWATRWTAAERGGLQSADVPFDVTQEDVMLQLDLIGGEIKAWAWRPGEPMPKDPLLFIRGEPNVSGTVAVTSTAGPGDSIGVFRFVQVSTTHIPEPSTAIMAVLAAVGFVGFGRRRR